MSELKPLPSLLQMDREVEVPFAAFLNGEPMKVTAVLERTAVVHPIHDASDRRLVRHVELMARPRDVCHAGLKATIWHGRKQRVVEKRGTPKEET